MQRFFFYLKLKTISFYVKCGENGFFFPCVLEKKSCGHVANEFLNNSEKILKNILPKLTSLLA